MTTTTERTGQARAAYDHGVSDGRASQDGGVDVWAYGPYADDYGAGVFVGIALQRAEERGYMTGDINQTDRWFDG